MDWILEMLLEFLLEGSVALISDKTAPLWVRLLAGAVLVGVCGGLLWMFTSMLCSGIRDYNVPLAVLGGVLDAGMILLAVMLYKRRH